MFFGIQYSKESVFLVLESVNICNAVAKANILGRIIGTQYIIYPIEANSLQQIQPHLSILTSPLSIPFALSFPFLPASNLSCSPLTLHLFISEQYLLHSPSHMKSIPSFPSQQAVRPQLQFKDDVETLSVSDSESYQPSYWQSHFPSYIFQKLITETEISLIWRARHRESNQTVAVKITERSEELTSERRHQENQDKFLGQHQFPHMSQVKQSQNTEDYRLLAMQLYPWTVSHLAAKATTKPHRRYSTSHTDFIIYAFKAMLQSVEEMHTAGFVHRDLKPDNFLVDAQFNIVITDFGLVTRELEVDQSRCGTIEYLPPERLSKLRRQSPVKRAVDVWALGVILYELFTGATPFNGDSEEEVLEEICEGFIRNKEIPAEAMCLIKGMLQVNAEKRLTLQEIKCHPFLAKEVQRETIKAMFTQSV